MLYWRDFIVALLLVAGPGASSAPGQTPERWAVDPTPTVTIGALDGPEGQILVNVLMATQLSDGSLVLRNSLNGTFELRYYDEDGTYVRTASRWGEGPFEFHLPLGVHRLAGDSLFVAGRNDYFAVFGPRGEEVREGQMGLRSYLPAILSSGVDTTHITFLKLGGRGAQPEIGTYRQSWPLMVFDLEAQAADSVAVYQDALMKWESAERAVRFFFVTPFSPETYVASGSGLIWVGDNAEPTILGYRAGEADPVVKIQSPFEAREVTRSDRSRLKEVYSGLFSGEHQERWARYARSMDFPEQMPSYGFLVVDRLGNLWVQEYEPPWTEGPQRWVVFSREGGRMAEALLPPEVLPACARRAPTACVSGSGILEIGPDYLLVPQRDEWGVVYLRKFTLHKPS